MSSRTSRPTTSVSSSGPDRVPVAEHHRLVDVGGRGDPVGHHPDRLQAEGESRAGRWRSRACRVRRRGPCPASAGERDGRGPVVPVGGGRADHDLQQRHRPDRVEEVQCRGSGRARPARRPARRSGCWRCCCRAAPGRALRPSRSTARLRSSRSGTASTITSGPSATSASAGPQGHPYPAAAASSAFSLPALHRPLPQLAEPPDARRRPAPGRPRPARRRTRRRPPRTRCRGPSCRPRRPQNDHSSLPSRRCRWRAGSPPRRPAARSLAPGCDPMQGGTAGHAWGPRRTG